MEFKGNPEELVGRQKEVFYIFTKLNTQNKHKIIPIPIFKK